VSAEVPGFRARLASPATAGIVFVFTVAATAASLPLAVLARQAAGNVLVFRAGVALLALVLGSVGLVVARHQRGNPMGWLALGSGLSFILGTDAEFYARLAYRLHPGRLPLGWVAVLLNAAGRSRSSSWVPLSCCSLTGGCHPGTGDGRGGSTWPFRRYGPAVRWSSS
jgi:hypothetical protein